MNDEAKKPSLGSLLQLMLDGVQSGAEGNLKTLRDLAEKAEREGRVVAPFSVLVTEVQRRTREDIALLKLMVHLANSIDNITITLEAVQTELQSLGIIKTELSSIKTLVNTHHKTYEEIQNALQQRNEASSKEVPYIT